jgi:putative adhesin
MQNQEYIHQTTEDTSASERQINPDPREQAPSQEPAYSAYTEGYRGNEMRDIWSEGQKLQPTPQREKSISGLLVIIALVCVAFIAGGYYGVILGWLSWVIVTLLISAAVVALIANWRVVVIPMPTRTFQINEHARLILNNSAGKIAIRRGEEGVISVAATKHTSGIGISPEKIQVHYDQYGDAVNITTDVAWNLFQFGMRSVEFEITVPASCDMQVGSGSGRLLVQGTQGNIRLSTGSGRIEMRDLQGQIAMKTGSGRIKADYIHGQILARTGSGGIEGSFLEGQVELITGSGGISVVQSTLQGISRFSTGSGGITFEGALDPSGKSEMKTGSGGIRLQLPDNAAFSLNAKTGSGGVHNAFGGNEVGNGPRNQLRLRTGSGGIHIIRNAMY